MSEPSAFVSAQEAANLLGVKTATLYAYVSRGQVQSVASKGRARLYRRADVLRLKAKREGRTTSSVELGSVLRWGDPVLDSSITEVLSDGPRYRGQSSIELCEARVGYEAVAELLWQGTLPEDPPPWPDFGPQEELVTLVNRVAALLGNEAACLPGLAVLVTAAGSLDPGRFDRSRAAVLPRARRMIRAMSQLLGAETGTEGSLADHLLAGLGGRKGCAYALDQLLVLWADHELNVSSFAARVAASAGSDLYSCVSAGLAALSGPRHGGACQEIQALLEGIKKPSQCEAVLNERASRGVAIPGFGHPLYPQGDPRALPLLDTARKLAPRSSRVNVIDALIELQAARGLAPTIDVGTVALCEALRLPRHVLLGLIAIGRCAGWVAHILEQYEAGFLIRPRARYRPG
jgi:citrate synthase